MSVVLMRLPKFLRENIEPICVEFEAFARTLMPPGADLSGPSLRDHAEAVLLAIANDMETKQSEGERQVKSHGHASPPGRETSAATHGAMRQMVGFDLNQVGAEFRALRASVLRLWKDKVEVVDADALEEMTRFNESLDQALAESIAAYSARTAESRDLFLAVLGHDLRSPLASLSGCIQLLAKLDPSELQKARALTIANRSVTTIDIMVTDLLEYTRTRLGRGIEVVPSLGDYGVLCEETVDEIRAAFVEREISFKRSGNLEFEFDIQRMRQVLTNLLGNAVQHGASEQPIEFEVNGESEMVTTSVKNFGTAIPSDAHELIFNPMVQLAKSRKAASGRPATSLGLGLFIAREIVKAHGATVEVRSSTEEGTVFTVRMPRQRPPDSLPTVPS